MSPAPDFPVGTLVQSPAVLNDRIRRGFLFDASHLSARKASTLGTVRSFELARRQTGNRPPPLVYFVQHEDHGSYAAYLVGELVLGMAPPRPPRLEEEQNGHGPFINLDFTGNPEGDHPCQLCADLLFPDGIPYGGTGDEAPRALPGQELCAPCLDLVREIVGGVRAMGPFQVVRMTLLAPASPAPADPVRVCLAMEYLGYRGVLGSEQAQALLPPMGERTSFRLARTWDLVERGRADWKGTACKAAWTCGGSWLRLRCTRCDVSLRYGRGCNMAGFQYATMGAWQDWMKHTLLGRTVARRRKTS